MLEELYHGSNLRIEGELKPVLEKNSPDHLHTKAAVFATERADLAALFMYSPERLHSIGFEQDIAYICIWGTREEALAQDQESFIYVLPAKSFEKIGKAYEWQSFTAVAPVSIRSFPSSISGMIENGVQVYFIDDNSLFDEIVRDTNNRAPILKNALSENQRREKNVRKFT